MENLSPPLRILLQLRLEMENGSSFRESLRTLLRDSGDDEFDSLVREWTVRKSHDQSTRELVNTNKSAYRRTLLDLFERGWAGEPILEALQALESELHDACAHELDEFVATLPFRAMIPLMLLQFPAYLLLLLGPVMVDLMRQLGAT